jgi:Family of unknown function (DUF6174)
MGMTLGTSTVNQVKWRKKGSASYVVTARLTALMPIGGVSVVTVRNGQIVQGVNPMCRGCKPDTYRPVTVERMFESAVPCSLLFPLWRCSFDYDPDYGYPTRMTIKCPIPDACYQFVQVEDIELTP